MRLLVTLLALCALSTACAAVPEPEVDDDTAEELEEDQATSEEALSSGGGSVSCASTKMSGYSNGSSFSLDVIKIGGKRVTRTTGHAFLKMQRAAKANGVMLSITSGFRTNDEQKHLYSCYLKKNCNGGHLAAKPGFSNHQSGKALDIGGGGSARWLARNAGQYGFRATVPGESWHYEYAGSDPGGPCSGSAKRGSSTTAARSGASSAPASAGDAGEACASNDDCNPGSEGSGKTCSNGTCVAGCTKSAECPGAQLCIEGSCEDE